MRHIYQNSTLPVGMAFVATTILRNFPMLQIVFRQALAVNPKSLACIIALIEIALQVDSAPHALKN